jgi:hypothetical protein
MCPVQGNEVLFEIWANFSVWSVWKIQQTWSVSAPRRHDLHFDHRFLVYSSPKSLFRTHRQWAWLRLETVSYAFDLGKNMRWFWGRVSAKTWAIVEIEMSRLREINDLDLTVAILLFFDAVDAPIGTHFGACDTGAKLEQNLRVRGIQCVLQQTQGCSLTRC